MAATAGQRETAGRWRNLTPGTMKSALHSSPRIADIYSWSQVSSIGFQVAEALCPDTSFVARTASMFLSFACPCPNIQVEFVPNARNADPRSPKGVSPPSGFSWGPGAVPADHPQAEADAVIPAFPELTDAAARFGRVRRPDSRLPGSGRAGRVAGPLSFLLRLPPIG
jgi:hypothetical protein